MKPSSWYQRVGIGAELCDDPKRQHQHQSLLPNKEAGLDVSHHALVPERREEKSLSLKMN
jgi:hypothetical protein